MDKVTVKTKQFGEISKLDNGNFSMTDAQVYAQLEECGLPNAKEVMKTVKAAKEKFAAKAYEFLGEQLKDTLEDQTLVAGTGDLLGKVVKATASTADVGTAPVVGFVSKPMFSVDSYQQKRISFWTNFIPASHA